VELYIIVCLLCKCLFLGNEPFLNYLLILRFLSHYYYEFNLFSQLENLHLFRVWVHIIPLIRDPWFDANYDTFVTTKKLANLVVIWVLTFIFNVVFFSHV